MASPRAHSRPIGLAVWLIIAGTVGWIAAFSLTTEKFAKLADPDAAASCDFSPLVQCSTNLQAWQGSVFGFPNPIIGVAGWVAPIAVGVAILAGARFARWFWLLFWAGMAFAMGFVIWLISQSLFALGTLCPWCMVTWAVTIPTFYAVTLHLLRSGVVPLPGAGRSLSQTIMTWVPLLTVVSYVAVAVLAQLQLDWIGALGR